MSSEISAPQSGFAVSEADGKRIAWFRWALAANQPRRGVVLMMHGLGEHILRYDPLARMLNSLGVDVIGMDTRGHGRSDGARGNIDSVEHVCKDMDSIREMCLTDVAANTPLFVFGHSMGGHLSLQYAFREERLRQEGAPRPHNLPLSGAIIDAPWVKLAFEPPAIKVFFGRLIGRVLPWVALDNGLEPKKLTRDPKMVDDYVNDPLVHRKISGATFLAINDGCQKMHAGQAGPFATLKMPIFLIHGTGDQILSYEASKTFMEQLQAQDKTHITVDGGYHELLMDICKDEFLEHVRQWVTQHLA